MAEEKDRPTEPRIAFNEVAVRIGMGDNIALADTPAMFPSDSIDSIVIEQFLNGYMTWLKYDLTRVLSNINGHPFQPDKAFSVPPLLLADTISHRARLVQTIRNNLGYLTNNIKLDAIYDRVKTLDQFFGPDASCSDVERQLVIIPEGFRLIHQERPYTDMDQNELAPLPPLYTLLDYRSNFRIITRNELTTLHLEREIKEAQNE